MAESDSPEQYRALCSQVFERDGWQCQFCGARDNLQVHHQQFRSEGGSDTLDNLITLCHRCHRRLHSSSALATSMQTT